MGVMRGALAIVLSAGCGFTAGGTGPSIDAAASDGARPIDSPTVDQMTDGRTGPQCPSTYGPIASLGTTASQYRFIGGGGKTWIEAEQDCEDDAAVGELATHLLVLDDALEATAVIGGFASGLNINDQWIGATDLADEDTVAYVTAQATTLMLAPTMDAPDKDCIRLKNTGGTEFKACDDTYKYVCECDGRSADPARFPNLPDGNGNE